MANTPRRGWREPVESGVHRIHRLACPSSGDRKPRRRCACPYEVRVPTGRRGGAMLTVDGNLEDARRARAKAIAEAGTVRAEPLARGDDTLHGFSIDYFRARAHRLRPGSLEVYERQYRTRIAPTLGSLRLDQLTRQRLEAWLAGLVERDPARRSVEQAVTALSSMLGVAAEWGRLPTNPALKLRLPARPGRAASGAERVLDRDQIAAMLAACKARRSQTLLRAAAETGMRRGELIGLRWDDVLLDERRIVVRRSVWQGGQGTRHVLTPKMGRTRRVAITDALADALDTYRAEQAVAGNDVRAGYVWPGRAGGPTGRDSPSNLLERVLDRAGLVDSEGKPLVSFHGLRHSAASIALASGVPLIVVSRQLGHSRVDVTAERYAHLLSDAELDAFGLAHADTGVERGVEQPTEGGESS
jgi:integrase